MEYIKLIDFLGIKPKLFINHYINHKTNLGGILSIICLIILSATVIYFTTILIERSNINIILNEELNPYSSINWTNIDLSITIIDKFGNLYPDDERIYGITGTYFWNEKNGTDSKIKMKLIETEKCSFEKHFFENYDLWSKENSVIGGWCPKKGQKIITQNAYGAINYSNIVYWVHMCKNTTLKNDCYPVDTIKNKLLDSFTVFKIIDIYFDHNENHDAGKPFILSETLQNSITVYKNIFLSFKNIDYYSDANYFLSYNNLKSYLKYADSKETFDLRPLNTTTIPNSILTISLTNNIKKNIFFRRYYKAQNMISDIGGIIKVILLIAKIINYIFNEKIFFTDIINYNLCNMNLSIEKMNGKLNVIDNSINGRESRLSILKPVDNSNNDNPLKIVVRSKNKSNNNKIEFPMYISCIPRFILTRKNNYRHIFDKLHGITNLIKKQLDIKCLISKINIIDKLSFLLFGDDHYSLLEGAPNPYITDKFLFIKDLLKKPNDSNEQESITTRINRNYNYLFNNKKI